MYLVLSGEVKVRMRGTARPVGRVAAGECLGEVALLTDENHSATAVAAADVEAGVLSRQDLRSLVRLRPGIGVILYRNLARGLGEKLRRADLATLDGVDLA